MFAGHLTQGPYTRATLIRVGLFVGATVAFPFVLYAIAKLVGCQSIAGSCGAVGLLVAMFGKPPIYLIFIASFISITARRLRDLRLPVALVGAVPIMMLANFSFGITFGAPWSLSFTMGTGGEWPRYLFMALICVAFLCVMPTSSGYLDSEKRWGLAGVIALSILLLATLDAAFTILRGVSIWLYGVKGIIIPPLMLRYFSLYGLPVLLTGSLMLVAWQQRKQT